MIEHVLNMICLFIEFVAIVVTLVAIFKTDGYTKYKSDDNDDYDFL